MYCGNNPVKYVDPDGKKLRFVRESTTEYKAQVRLALKHLDKHDAGDLYKSVDKHLKNINIAEGTGKTTFDPSTNTLYWDPIMGIKTTNGKYLSPTTALNHEMDHAKQELYNPDKKHADKNSPDSKYDDKEEKRVIEGSEQDTAKKLGEIKEGEVTRTDHTGSTYETEGPTTTNPRLTNPELEIIVTP